MIQHSENFFPAECGELLALLVKYYKDNPAVKGDKELKGVTAQNIYTFYKEMMEDIDKLPEEIKTWYMFCLVILQQIGFQFGLND